MVGSNVHVRVSERWLVLCHDSKYGRLNHNVSIRQKKKIEKNNPAGNEDLFLFLRIKWNFAVGIDRGGHRHTAVEARRKRMRFGMQIDYVCVHGLPRFGVKTRLRCRERHTRGKSAWVRAWYLRGFKKRLEWQLLFLTMFSLWEMLTPLFSGRWRVLLENRICVQVIRVYLDLETTAWKKAPHFGQCWKTH